MKTICLVVFCGIIIGCQAYTAVLVNAVNKDFPGECYDPVSKTHFKPGEERPRSNSCGIMRCSDNFSLHYVGCGAVPEGHCDVITPDSNLPYPQCCQRCKE